MGSENEVLIIIPSVEYQNDELTGVKEALSEASIGIKIASVSANECRGVSGGSVIPDFTFENVDVERFDGVVFIGGPGTEIYLHDQAAHEIARSFFKTNKLVAAICWASAILANAGVLRGKSATSWDGAKNDLVKNGAKYTGESVTVDGNIITANGPDVAMEFGQEIAKYLIG